MAQLSFRKFCLASGPLGCFPEPPRGLPKPPGGFPEPPGGLQGSRSPLEASRNLPEASRSPLEASQRPRMPPGASGPLNSGRRKDNQIGRVVKQPRACLDQVKSGGRAGLGVPDRGPPGAEPLGGAVRRGAPRRQERRPQTDDFPL